MSLDNIQKKRQLTANDIEQGREFTIAQPTTLWPENKSSDFDLRIGDVIKIERCYSNIFAFSVNGRPKKDQPLIKYSDASYFVVEIPE